MNDIIHAIGYGEVTALVLLDLSAAFDTVDHSTLLDVLHRRFAVEGTPLQWFKSYLTNRLQVFICRRCSVEIYRRRMQRSSELRLLHRERRRSLLTQPRPPSPVC